MTGEGQQPDQAPTAGSPSGPIFLVVDDDPMLRKIVSRGLSQLNPAEILEEVDGHAAMKVLQSRSVDVVITDVVMPNMDGLELMKWARANCPGPLWIVLSGLDTFDAAVEALQLGAFDYLAKPPEVPRVRIAVRNALDQLELVRERRRLYSELEDRNAELADNVDQLQKLCRVLEEQATVIQADLDRAEIIQRALLPQDPPELADWCMETLYRPGSSVGGDFYDAVRLGDHYLSLVIADAAGHGVAAAMLSVLFKLRLRQVDPDGDILAPAEVLRHLNRQLGDMLSTSNAFVTAAYALIDLRSGQGQLASAGHPPCILTGPDGASQRFERTGPALGLEADPDYGEHSFQLDSDGRLLFYTDGVLEGGPDSPDCDDLCQRIAGGGDRGEMMESLFQDAVRDHPGDRDDITLLLVERAAGVSHFDDTSPRENPLEAAPVTPAPDEPHLLQGAADGRGYISVVGSVTWLVSQALLEAARTLQEKNDGLTLDLARCEHMDSTCLGTVHEIVNVAPGQVDVQGVSDAVRSLFEELSMRVVLDSIRDELHPLPADLAVIATANLTPQQQGARILSAHESLAELSEHNRQQFQAVVDSLRADLAGGD